MIAVAVLFVKRLAVSLLTLLTCAAAHAAFQLSLEPVFIAEPAPPSSPARISFTESIRTISHLGGTHAGRRVQSGPSHSFEIAITRTAVVF